MDKKILSLLACVLVTCFIWTDLVQAQSEMLPIKNDEEPIRDIDEHSFASEGIVLMDARTGAILYAQNEGKRFFPASITKIVTGLLALEQVEDLGEVVNTSALARGVEGNRIYLEEGEQTPLLNLVYGLMLNSGNDAAIALAEHIGGSVDRFVLKMNERAQQAGATQTNFITPNGLHDKDHYTTPLDMARIAQSALQNPLFREIVATKEKPWFGEEWHSKLINTNKLLWEYEGMTGIKTGYTRKAQQTYVGSAKKGDTELIVVLMKAERRSELWDDARTLLDYGFAHYETQKLMEKGDTVSTEIYGEERQLQLKEDLYVTKKLEEDGAISQHIDLQPLPFFHPMLKTGTPVGQLIVEEANKFVGQAFLALGESLPPNRPVAQHMRHEQQTRIAGAVGEGSDGEGVIEDGFSMVNIGYVFVVLMFLFGGWWVFHRFSKRRTPLKYPRIYTTSIQHRDHRHWPPR